MHDDVSQADLVGTLLPYAESVDLEKSLCLVSHANQTLDQENCAMLA
jgi:hypothetical protein